MIDSRRIVDDKSSEVRLDPSRSEEFADEGRGERSGVLYVTRPSLPPIDEFVELLRDIWDTKWLTNKGPYHEQFEEALAEYLGVKYVSLFANGTLALVTALQALRITGEVITTPYSFVATVHALHWNGITPVFCDIEPDTCNIDPEKIESLITPKTTAILPVHVYGTPCNVQEIEKIADIYGLKVIYDACHAFGVTIEGETILNFGDLSVLSFHATKVFTTFEGGAIVSHDEKMKRRIDFLKNFGFANEVTVVGPGINAKMSEFQAAIGLLQLKYIDDAIEKRGKLAGLYYRNLSELEGIRMLEEKDGVRNNHQYFPVFIERDVFGRSRDDVYNEFRKNNIMVRRYFYPLISQFPTYKGLPSAVPGNLPVAERITKEVLCLPLYSELGRDDINRICDILYRLKR